MLALAVVSVGMLLYETWGPVTPEQSRQILRADLVIIGIFALEFTVRWIRDPQPKTFPLRYWYEILGMIPVAHPAIRGFRLFRIIRIVVILSRFGRAMDRTFGEEFTARMLGRFRTQVVEAVSGAVTLRVLSETASVLERGTYARNMADAIESHGDGMLEVVLEKVKADPELGAVRHLPFFDTMVSTSARVTRRIVIDLLRDPRTDAVVRDVLRENVRQIQAAVQASEASASVPAKAAVA